MHDDSLMVAPQVVWWINLASLGLYVIMVAVAAVTLKRGFSLGQRRMGMIILIMNYYIYQYYTHDRNSPVLPRFVF